MKCFLKIIALCLLVLPMCLPTAFGAGRVIVIVNDQPITSFDVEQRIAISEILGDKPGSNPKPKVLQELINDELKRGEAVKLNAMPSERQIDEALSRIAKGAGTDVAGLQARLKAKRINWTDVREQVATSIAFNRLINAKYQIKVSVDEAEVTRRLEQFKADPRLKPVVIYKLLEVMLPVENVGAMSSQLMMARAVEAQQLMSRYSGCASARKAAQGIFNVKVGKVFDADSGRLPKELKAALDKAGTKRLVGPIQGPGGVQLLGLCGTEKLSPEPPNRQQIENLIINEKYASFESRYVKELRRTAFIDYKDKSYIPKN